MREDDATGPEPETPPRVLLSYSHDSPEHARRVLELAQRLRDEGIDAIIDQFDDAPAEGWPRWMLRQIREADFIVVIASAGYRAKCEDEVPRGLGRGVKWESHLTLQELYDDGGYNYRYVPVLFDDASERDVPRPLAASTIYELPQQYDDLSSENGVISNGLDVVENIKTVGNVLSEKGYETVFAGKLHVVIPKSYGDQIPGFSKVLCEGIGGKGTMGDQVVSSVCEGYLQNRDKSKPFFLSVHFLQPHDICNWISRFSKDTEYNPFLDLIKNDLPDLPENFTFILDEPAKMKVGRKEDWTELQWRYYLWSYYRMIEEADAEIGRVIKALAQSGEMENTVIIFNVDHGEGGAHHQSVLKDTPYDESSHVPLIICYPKELKQNKMDEKTLVSGLDIVPTICDFAGAEVPDNAKGMSLRGIAAGKGKLKRDFVVIELNHDTGRVLRTSEYKLVAFRDDPQLLFFDMKNDPGETINLAEKKDYKELLNEHIKMLEQWESKLILAPNATGAFKVSGK